MDPFPAGRPDTPVANVPLATAAGSAALTDKPRGHLLIQPLPRPNLTKHSFRTSPNVHFQVNYRHPEASSLTKSKSSLAFAVRR
jgi:hypothetical protein